MWKIICKIKKVKQKYNYFNFNKKIMFIIFIYQKWCDFNLSISLKTKNMLLNKNVFDFFIYLILSC